MSIFQTKIDNLFQSHHDVDYLPNTDVSALDGIVAGAVFIHCFASSPSVRSLNQFAELMERVDTESLLEIRVIDTDSIHAIFHHPLIRDKLGGWGEVAWVRNGNIVFASVGKNACDQFEEHALQLLAEIAG